MGISSSTTIEKQGNLGRAALKKVFLLQLVRLTAEVMNAKQWVTVHATM